MTTEITAQAAALKRALVCALLMEAAPRLRLKPGAIEHVAAEVLDELELTPRGRLESSNGRSLESVVADRRELGQMPFAFVTPEVKGASGCAFSTKQLRLMNPRQRLSAINGEPLAHPKGA
jgi:hypothetical protein